MPPKKKQKSKKQIDESIFTGILKYDWKNSGKFQKNTDFMDRH